MQTIEKQSTESWVESLSTLNRYLGSNWQGHGNLCSEPRYLSRQSAKRESAKQAVDKWQAWLKSDEYKKLRQDRLNEAVKQQQAAKKASLKAVVKSDKERRKDYDSEFQSYSKRCQSTKSNRSPDQVIADMVTSLTEWACKRQRELAERRGLTIGDTSLDFGRAKCSFALIKLMTSPNAWSRIFKMRIRGNSLPFIATRVFRRGIEQGKGIGKSLDASWTGEDEHSEISAYNLQLAGMDTALRDMKARQLVLARRMLLATAKGDKTNNASISAQRRAARLGWLLANGARLNDATAIDAGYKSLSLALHSLGRGVAKGFLTRYGEACQDEVNHVEFRNQTMFAEVEPEYAKENDIANAFPFAHLDLNPTNAKLRRKFRSRPLADDTSKLQVWFKDRQPLNAKPAKRVTRHMPRPIKPLKLKSTANRWNESSLLAEWFIARLPINR